MCGDWAPRSAVPTPQLWEVPTMSESMCLVGLDVHASQTHAAVLRPATGSCRARSCGWRRWMCSGSWRAWAARCARTCTSPPTTTDRCSCTPPQRRDTDYRATSRERVHVRPHTLAFEMLRLPVDAAAMLRRLVDHPAAAVDDRVGPAGRRAGPTRLWRSSRRRARGARQRPGPA